MLNFLVIGECRSGLGAVRSAINSSGGLAYCHGPVLSADRALTKRLHLDYFGAEEADPPLYFVSGEDNARRHLERHIFGRPRHDEKAIGAVVAYGDLERHGLFDYLRDCWLRGDFACVHLRRNPVACFVSLKQAEGSGNWSRAAAEPLEPPDRAVWAEDTELSDFIRAHSRVRRQLEAACGDLLAVDFAEILRFPEAALARLAWFLELPTATALRFGTRRLNHGHVAARLENFDQLARELPPDVRRHFAEELR